MVEGIMDSYYSIEQRELINAVYDTQIILAVNNDEEFSQSLSRCIIYVQLLDQRYRSQ